MLQPRTFLASQADASDAKVVMFGVPMDYTVCFRPGTRFGPAHIRQASYGLEHYSLQFRDTVQNRSFYDAGDLVLPFGNATDSLRRTEAFAKEVVANGQHPFALGGEHLISLPVIRSVFGAYPNLHVLHIDAHADLADEYFDEAVTHATVMRRVLDFLPHEHFFQFGIRSADRPEVEFIESSRLSHFPFQVVEPLAKVLEGLHPDTPIYVSLDVDALDPAFAPGTGTPEAGGITPHELFQVFSMLRGRNVVGADFVEVAPNLDASGCTEVLGAKVVREMLLTLFERVATTSDAQRPVAAHSN